MEYSGLLKVFSMYLGGNHLLMLSCMPQAQLLSCEAIIVFLIAW